MWLPTTFPYIHRNPLALQLVPPYAPFMSTPDTHLTPQLALERWARGRAQWEAAGCPAESWEQLVGRWADAYDQAVRRQLQERERDEAA